MDAVEGAPDDASGVPVSPATSGGWTAIVGTGRAGSAAIVGAITRLGIDRASGGTRTPSATRAALGHNTTAQTTAASVAEARNRGTMTREGSNRSRRKDDLEGATPAGCPPIAFCAGVIPGAAPVARVPASEASNTILNSPAV